MKLNCWAYSLSLFLQSSLSDELASLRADRAADWPYELLRFLRGSKWELDKAREMYRTYHTWRREKRIDTLYDPDVPPFNAELLGRIVGSNAAGEDKEGRPLYIEKSGGLHVDGMLSLFTDEDIMRAHVWQQEHSCARAMETSKRLGKKVENFTQILDLDGLSSAHQRAIKFTKEIVAKDSIYYPERLGHLFVVNPPWIFPVLWKLVKGWIDPVTRAKIHVIKGDPKETLLEYIDASQLPAEVRGGK